MSHAVNAVTPFALVRAQTSTLRAGCRVYKFQSGGRLSSFLTKGPVAVLCARISPHWRQHSTDWKR